MHQIADFDTRVTAISKTKIDLLYTNSREVRCQTLDECQTSDHDTIMFSLEHNNDFQMRKNIKIVSWEFYNQEALVDCLRLCNFGNFNNVDLDNKVAIVKTSLLNAMNKLTYQK